MSGLGELSNKYDLMIVDSSKDDYDDVFGLQENVNKTVFLLDEMNGFDYNSIIMHYINMNYDKKIILILNTINVDSLFGLFKNNNNNITILDLYTGISGFTRKISPVINEIVGIMNLGFDVYEPFDIQSLYKILDINTRKYIRLNDNEMVDNFGIDYNKTILLSDLSDKSLESNSNRAIFVSGSYVYVALYAGSLLKNMGVEFDIFGFCDYSIVLNNNIIEFLKNKSDIFFIVDQKRSALYEGFVKNKFFEYGFVDLDIKFIYPKYEKLTTVFADYKLEQLEFDGPHIAKTIYDSIF